MGWGRGYHDLLSQRVTKTYTEQKQTSAKEKRKKNECSIIGFYSLNITLYGDWNSRFEVHTNAAFHRFLTGRSPSYILESGPSKFRGWHYYRKYLWRMGTFDLLLARTIQHSTLEYICVELNYVGLVRLWTISGTENKPLGLFKNLVHSLSPFFFS